MFSGSKKRSWQQSTPSFVWWDALNVHHRFNHTWVCTRGIADKMNAHAAKPFCRSSWTISIAKSDQSCGDLNLQNWPLLQPGFELTSNSRPQKALFVQCVFPVLCFMCFMCYMCTLRLMCLIIMVSFFCRRLRVGDGERRIGACRRTARYRVIRFLEGGDVVDCRSYSSSRL